MSRLFSLNKYSGAGNVFFVIDDRKETFPVHDIQFIQSLCESVDGILLLQTLGNDHRMRIFNKDGSEAESCGNGLRCMARYLLDEKIPTQNRIWMQDRWIDFFYEKDQVGVCMGSPKDLKLHILTEKGPVHFVDTGVPHAIQFVPDPRQIDLMTFGPWLRYHPLFQPRGTNASVAAIESDGSIRIRTYERGVEGETLACGTGACAAYAIASALFGSLSTREIHFPGGTLKVSLKNWFPQVCLMGPASKVF